MLNCYPREMYFLSLFLHGNSSEQMTLRLYLWQYSRLSTITCDLLYCQLPFLVCNSATFGSKQCLQTSLATCCSNKYQTFPFHHYHLIIFGFMESYNIESLVPECSPQQVNYRVFLSSQHGQKEITF